jgi:penicillin amidase
MKYLFFTLSLLITSALIIILDRPLGPAPALGKFLSPFVGFWQNAENVSSQKEVNYSLDELKDEVTVIYDERNVPHIFAKNDADMFFMQGYITASHRLWQMEIQTHNAAGRVSEIIGEKGLESDRLNRRIGLKLGAERAQDFIIKDTETKDAIDAYCKGINHYIENLSAKDYPLEYKLLGYAPEKWTPLKAGLLLKNMANMLSVYEFDVENSNFVATYGEEQLKYLYQDLDDFKDFIIAEGDENIITEAAPYNLNKRGNVEAKASAKDVAPYESYRNTTQKPDEIRGSNNWAVAGRKTKLGKPILCNDPHLALNLPSIWYEVHLVSPNYNVYGASLPGSPAVISGFNDSIAWGVTNAGRDVRDWFEIKFKDETYTEYWLDSAWVKSEKKIERFDIKGKEPFLDTIIHTVYGPVVFDKSYKAQNSKNLLAMRWTAHLPSNEMKTFLLLNKGKNYDHYREAISHFTCPAQNFVFASKSDDIAIVQQGKFPNVSDRIVDGSFSENNWNAFIPNEHNPSTKNPSRGFVSSANQFPISKLYPYPISPIGVYENFRAIRINELLSKNDSIDASVMKKLHSDNFNIFAQMLVPTLVDVARRSGKINEDIRYIEKLESWNFYNNQDQVEPVIFEEWSNQLISLLWDEMSQPDLPMKRPNNYLTARFLALDSTSIFYDNQQTGEREFRENIVLQSWSKAKSNLAEKYGSINKIPDWGTHKATYIKHLAKLDPLSRLNVYCGGNRGIVNATNADHGPSWKMVVDFGEMKAYCVYPGGQSGNPGSPYYDNMVDTWAKGEYYEAHFSNQFETLESNALSISYFKPKK